MRFRVAFPEESVKIAAQSIMASYHTPIKTRRASERDGILFWILPPLLIAWLCSQVILTGMGEQNTI